MQQFNWKLNESNFTPEDRQELANFFLDEANFWTMGKQVQQFEQEMASFVGVKYAVFTSSGSTANTLLAMYTKDRLSSGRFIVVLPTTTWITSVSPFVREGFSTKFIDINLGDLSMDLDRLEEYLKKEGKIVACVFITSLLGFPPDIDRILYLSRTYKVPIFLDNCESLLSTYNGKNISSYTTSTTSTYFGHHIQSIEGGFIFTNNQEEYEYFLMARNHGMTRSLDDPSRYLNPNVDPRFDFNIMGNNFRNSDIHALVGRLDLKRASYYSASRRTLYLDMLIKLMGKYAFPTEKLGSAVPFSFPVLCPSDKVKEDALAYCRVMGIETRPIISGNLLRQTCLSNYAAPHLFPNSEMLHRFGFYVGLHSKVNLDHANEFCDYLVSIA